MTIKKEYVGENPDGSQQFAISSDHPNQYHAVDNPDPEAVGIIWTGPIFGKVTAADGTLYEVSDDFIEAPMKHHGEISHAIGARHTAEGHPKHTNPDVPYVHECTDHCGGFYTAPTAPVTTVPAAPTEA